MACETDNRRAVAASRPQIVDFPVTHLLGLETESGQSLPENFLATGIIRRKRRARDQLAR